MCCAMCFCMIYPIAPSSTAYIVNITLYLFCLSKCFATLNTGAPLLFSLYLCLAHASAVYDQKAQHSRRAHVVYPIAIFRLHIHNISPTKCKPESSPFFARTTRPPELRTISLALSLIQPARINIMKASH